MGRQAASARVAHGPSPDDSIMDVAGEAGGSRDIDVSQALQGARQGARPGEKGRRHEDIDRPKATEATSLK
ncbi:unnamed protein product [Lampetra fluviatilis]